MKKTLTTIALLAMFLPGCGQRTLSTQTTKTADKQVSSTSGANVAVQESATGTDQAHAGYPSSPEQITLKKTFVKYFANPNYASNGKNLFINPQDAGSGYGVNYQIAKNIDLKTFELLDGANGMLFRDKNALYVNVDKNYSLKDSLKTITNVDKSTAGAVSYLCLKDKSRVYCDEPSVYTSNMIALRVVNSADPATFVKITEQENYFKDKNGIFCNSGAKSVSVQKLLGADLDTFTVIPSSTEEYAKDLNAVYHACTKMVGADPATFHVLANPAYEADKNNVYFDGWKMPGADPATFVIFNLFLTKDKNAVYQNGLKVDKIADPATFVAEDFTNGKDKYNHYEIIRWGDKRGLVVTVKSLK